MSRTEFSFDGVEVMQSFRDLTLKEMRKATKTALRRGASIITRQTKKNIRSRFPAAQHKSQTYSDTIISGARHKVDKKGDFAKSHIMGTKKRSSQTFKLRFFEGGTKVRKTHKGKNLGKIKPLWFFRDAVNSTKDDVQSAIEQKLIQTIKKINDANINGK